MLDENYQDLAKVYKGLREKIENDIKTGKLDNDPVLKAAKIISKNLLEVENIYDLGYLSRINQGIKKCKGLFEKI